MAKFFDQDGKQLTEEELEQAVGGLTFTGGSSFFKLLTQRQCANCKSIEFTIDHLTADNKVVYIRCKKCGTLNVLENK